VKDLSQGTGCLDFRCTLELVRSFMPRRFSSSWKLVSSGWKRALRSLDAGNDSQLCVTQVFSDTGIFGYGYFRIRVLLKGIVFQSLKFTRWNASLSWTNALLNRQIGHHGRSDLTCPVDALDSQDGTRTACCSSKLCFVDRFELGVVVCL